MPNLCKFPMSVFQEYISISNYVKEIDVENLKEKLCMKQNRIILIVQGEGSFSIDGETVFFHSGDVIFCFFNENVFLSKGKSLVCMYMDFQGMRTDDLFRRFSISRYNRVFNGYEGLIPLWDESLSRASDQTLDLAAESILLYTFSRLFADSSSKNSVVAEVVKITEQEFTDPELSITSIAKRLSYNPKYLSHTFKEQRKVAYSQYLQSVRMKYAISLFDRGLDSIKNVSMLSGFSDPLYFSNVFKKQVGVSPKDYVKRINLSEKDDQRY